MTFFNRRRIPQNTRFGGGRGTVARNHGAVHSTGCVLCALTLFFSGSGNASTHASDLVFFHAEWLGTTDAVASGVTLSPVVAERVGWTKPDGGAECLELSPASRMEYQVDSKFPGEAGTLEFRMWPVGVPDAECDVLRLKTADGSSITLAFVPAGPRWVFRLQSQGTVAEVAAWRDEIKYGQWNHMVLTWGSDATAALYVNGKWVRSHPFVGRPGQRVTMELRGASGTSVTIGPVVIYSRSLAPSQAVVLSQVAGQVASARLTRIQEQISRDDKAAVMRRELVARLEGKVGRVYHTRGRATGSVPLPEGIVATGIRPEDIGKVDLSAFRVIYFPQGPNFQIEPDQYAIIQDYIRQGGGYVGDCQGAYFAADKLKLLPIDCYHNNIWGLYKIGISPHFVTDNGRGEATMHFGNGPIMVAGEGCDVFGRYAMKLPGNAVPAAMVAGTYGAGRVILFGPHPLGEKVAYKGTAAHFSGKLLGTERMFVNALLLASGLVNDDGAPQSE